MCKWQNDCSNWLFLNWLSLRVLLLFFRRTVECGSHVSAGLGSNWRGHKIIFIVLVLGHIDRRWWRWWWWYRKLRCPTMKLVISNVACLPWYGSLGNRPMRVCVCRCGFACRRISFFEFHFEGETTTHCCLRNELFIWTFRWHYCAHSNRNFRVSIAANRIFNWRLPFLGDARLPMSFHVIENIWWLLIDENDSITICDGERGRERNEGRIYCSCVFALCAGHMGRKWREERGDREDKILFYERE